MTSREAVIPFEEFIKENGWKGKVILTLLFTPKLTEEELEGILKVHQKTLSKLEEKYKKNPGKWNPTETANRKIRLPKFYTEHDSIYLETCHFGYIVDETIFKQYKGILKLLNQTLKSYKNP